MEIGPAWPSCAFEVVGGRHQSSVTLSQTTPGDTGGCQAAPGLGWGWDWCRSLESQGGYQGNRFQERGRNRLVQRSQLGARALVCRPGCSAPDQPPPSVTEARLGDVGGLWLLAGSRSVPILLWDSQLSIVESMKARAPVEASAAAARPASWLLGRPAPESSLGGQWPGLGHTAS